MSKKVIFVVALVATLTVTALAGAGLAFAQEPTSPAPDSAPCYGCGGWGMRGGWGGGSGWGWHGMGLIDALAELITGLEPADLYAELQQGKTLLEVADAHGVSAEQLVETALASRAQVLQQRVGAGYLTQEQADWMLEHMEEEMLEHLEAGVTPGFNCGRFGGQPAPNAQSGGWGGWRGGGRWMRGSTF
ncbi:MAG: hypothetical protein OEW09_01100 [Anaerolineae bacterium]|nr:hypothetical protein [Anaerolineae bacterium]